MSALSGKTTRVRKSNLQNDEKRKEELLEAARKRVECERRAMKIVERLLETSISKSFFEDCGKYITSKQFEDVAVERAIEKLCGYPMCANKLTNIPKQQYHISLKSKKVFDITERKNFCSQRCFQAYKYYQAQLNDEPVWSRDHKNIPRIKLFENDASAATNTSLKPQNEIIMKQEVEMPNAKEQTGEGPSQGQEGLTSGVSGMGLGKSDGEMDQRRKDQDKRREEMLRRIAESVERPTKEGQNHRTKDSRSHDGGPRHVAKSLSCTVDKEQEVTKHTHPPDELHLSNQSKLDQTASTVDIINEKCEVPNKENIAKDGMDKLNQMKLVQTGLAESKDSVDLEEDIAPEEMREDDTKKADETRPKKSLSSSDQRTSHEKKKAKKKKKKVTSAENPMLVILQHIQQCIMEWRTDETLRHIYGGHFTKSGDQVYSGDSDTGKDGNLKDGDQDLKKKALKEFEKRVGNRLDREDLREGAFPAPSKPMPDFDRLRREEEERYALRVREFFMGGEMTAPSEPAVKDEEEPLKPLVESIVRAESLPPVDSRAQLTIRRKIILDKLGAILPGIAVSLQLSVHEVNPLMTDLVRTFHPGNQNISFKPIAWTLLTVLLIHM
ncbi:putative RNA polymerase II subunit B1 CTD phosphatase RPAP2 [Lytechinus variegatus]|uniref:putative RNA polymerase II subunit B1 CTD phosphatase RPAP2 n=1 Tax=Lytechinus variegatus TaxID=7654 RepID=UPI001BB1F149|nr:putative RNA polymerase II subunit B1 CTD phosphatase RPAP2 [Lytechinus variegatus]